MFCIYFAVVFRGVCSAVGFIVLLLDALLPGPLNTDLDTALCLPRAELGATQYLDLVAGSSHIRLQFMFAVVPIRKITKCCQYILGLALSSSKLVSLSVGPVVAPLPQTVRQALAGGRLLFTHFAWSELCFASHPLGSVSTSSAT